VWSPCCERVAEVDSSRGGAVAGVWLRRILVLALGIALSVDFHGVFVGPRLWAGSSVVFVAEFAAAWRQAVENVGSWLGLAY
jgi:hypothetical protein